MPNAIATEYGEHTRLAGPGVVPPEPATAVNRSALKADTAATAAALAPACSGARASSERIRLMAVSSPSSPSAVPHPASPATPASPASASTFLREIITALGRTD